MKKNGSVTKAALARSLGVSRSSLYYVSKLDAKDWALKQQIEAVLREQHAYGSRSLRDALHIGRHRIRRVMRKYGIKPYRRRGKKWHRKKVIPIIYPNLLAETMPSHRHHIWAADFTELGYKGKIVYVATTIDLYSREIVGVAISLRKGTVLVMQALWNALLNHPHPTIFHSDNGTEYAAKSFIQLLTRCSIKISRSHPGCPWENGYQESFYGKFKVGFGDPNRFSSLGELVAEIYAAIWRYNNTRIHSALRMPPTQFIKKMAPTPSSHSLKPVRLGV